jgi:hypothetical protein
MTAFDTQFLEAILAEERAAQATRRFAICLRKEVAASRVW